MNFTATQLAEILSGEIVGDPSRSVNNFAKIEDANETELSFISNPKYAEYAATSNAGILLVDKDFEIPTGASATFIKVQNAYSSLAQLMQMYEDQKNNNQVQGIEDQAYIDSTSSYGEGVFAAHFSYVGKRVEIGNNVKIYPHVFIGDNCEIGDGTILYSGAKVYRDCKIGKNCIIHSGVVLGSDGFGFAPQPDGSYKKMPQIGNVELGDYVEIGANTVVDRATIGSTVLKNGVKLDNLVQIAHNVELGNNTVVAAQAGISGSTKLGSQVQVGGQAGLVGHIKIADGVQINAQSGVSKNVAEPGLAITGSPAMKFREFYKGQANLKRIPELLERLKNIEESINNAH